MKNPIEIEPCKYCGKPPIFVDTGHCNSSTYMCFSKSCSGKTAEEYALKIWNSKQEI